MVTTANRRERSSVGDQAGMVIKPSADDYVTLSVMAIALVVGAIFLQRGQTTNVGLQSSG